MGRKIFFVHINKAHLPEVEAYSSFFSSYGYDKIEILYSDLLKIDKKILKDNILWYFMGFYPFKLEASLVIHDYRSLSVGNFAKFKNFIKKLFNHKPDIRIFLNSSVKKEFNFCDNVPSLEIDMGIPESIKKYVNLEIEKEYDFIYVGVINYDRKINKMIEGFLESYGNKKKILLAGMYEPKIKEEFSHYNNVIFYGRVEQEKVFELIKKSQYSICTIPNKYPYNLQTPTKLLEYLALKSKVIANKNPMIINVLKKTNNLEKVYLMNNEYDFPSFQELSFLQETCLNIEEYLWEGILKKSGILECLDI